MRSMRLAPTSLLLLALALSLAPAAAGTQSGDDECTTTRIGLVRSFGNVRQVTLSASSDYTLTRNGAGKIASYTALEPLTIKAADSQLSLVSAKGLPVPAGTSATMAPTNPAAVITIDSPGRQSKQYRGAIEVSLRSGALRLVNIVQIEDYLPGVLVGEMPSRFPDEALKAQAVAARSFTLRSRGKHASSGYDLCDGVHCQVYDGCMREHPSCNRAVTATKGQILTYNGSVASAMYCADCGGATQRYAESYGVDSFPYLTTVAEPADIVHKTWERTYKLEELATRLLAGGVREAEGLQKLCVTKTGSSGRALEVELSGAKASTTISGAKLRSILGNSVIGSCLFTIESAADGSIVFRGKGLGHGIGMCQTGAAALASAPHNYTCQQILAHYYPGTTLTHSRAGTQLPLGQSYKGAVANPLCEKASRLDVRVCEPKL